MFYTEWNGLVAVLVVAMLVVVTIALVMVLYNATWNKLRESRRLTHMVRTQEFVTVCRKNGCTCPRPHYVGHLITLSNRNERSL